MRVSNCIIPPSDLLNERRTDYRFPGTDRNLKLGELRRSVCVCVCVCVRVSKFCLSDIS